MSSLATVSSFAVVSSTEVTLYDGRKFLLEVREVSAKEAYQKGYRWFATVNGKLLAADEKYVKALEALKSRKPGKGVIITDLATGRVDAKAKLQRVADAVAEANRNHQKATEALQAGKAVRSRRYDAIRVKALEKLASLQYGG